MLKEDSKIDHLVDGLVNRLAETPMWDIKQMREIVKIFLKRAVNEYLGSSSVRLLEERDKYRQLLKEPVSKGERTRIERNLEEINRQLKALNQNAYPCEERYNNLKQWVREKYGEEALKSYLNLNSKLHRAPIKN